MNCFLNLNWKLSPLRSISELFIEYFEDSPLILGIFYQRRRVSWKRVKCRGPSDELGPNKKCHLKENARWKLTRPLATRTGRNHIQCPRRSPQSLFKTPRTLPFRDTDQDMRFGYKDNNTKSLADEGKIRKLAGLELEWCAYCHNEDIGDLSVVKGVAGGTVH